MKAVAVSVDAYITGFPPATQAVLKQLRSVINTTARQAEEKISYGMPAFTLHGKNLLYYAGYKNHVGLYAIPNVKEFKKDYSKYKTSGKGTIQFPLDKPLPVTLIKRIVKYRIQQLTPKT
ncbi:MAG: DUF1801 domain-containing protein [Cytophagales bacterium]|nr:DUF1801 domain-containing protein [Cytophagales bacterium]